MTRAVLGHEATAKAFPAVAVLCQCYCLCACVSFVIMLDVKNVLWDVCVCVRLEVCTFGRHSFVPWDARRVFHLLCKSTIRFQVGDML